METEADDTLDVQAVRLECLRLAVDAFSERYDDVAVTKAAETFFNFVFPKYEVSGEPLPAMTLATAN